MNDVIITGAGASAAEGAPLQASLLADFWRGERQSLLKARRARDEASEWQKVLLDLDDYFRSFYGIDVTQVGKRAPIYPTYEEVLGILELALQNREDFYDFQQHDFNSAISTTHHHFVLLIAVLLHRTRKSKPKVYTQLLTSLRQSNRLATTSFVTLNYDTFLDDAVVSAVGSNCLQYGIPLRLGEPNRQLMQEPLSINVFKMHGSLNWLYCACCRTVDLQSVESVIPGGDGGTPFCGCGNVKRPVILPPSFQKSTTGIHMQQLWARIEEAIAAADRLIFCGYSFPDADLNFKYILKRAQLRVRASNSSLISGPKHDLVRAPKLWSKILVLNNHPGKQDAQKLDESVRYKRFFGPEINLEYTDFTFSDFAADCTVVDN